MERRTATVSKELARHHVDIAAISESRLADEGSLTEHGSGYTFYWKGVDSSKGGVRNHGVGFAIHKDTLKKLEAPPVGINERLMTLRVPLSKGRYALFVSAYAPTLNDRDEIKEQFYAELNKILKTAKKTDKVVLLGDFNARVGSFSEGWRGILGRQGIGKANSNGMLLLSQCSEHSLTITNTVFRQANRLKGTWQHPRSKHWHMIDFVIVRSRDLSDVLSTRAVLGSDACDIDHRMVISRMRLQVAPRRRKSCKGVTRRLDVSRLQSSEVRAKFEDSLRTDFPHARDPHFEGLKAEDHWRMFRDKVLSSCHETLGTVTRKHQDWFDDNDKDMTEAISRKRAALLEWQRHPHSAAKASEFRAAKAAAQKKAREVKDAWWKDKALETELYASRHQHFELFKSLKSIYGPTSKGLSAVRSEDGSLITDHDKVLL